LILKEITYETNYKLAAIRTEGSTNSLLLFTLTDRSITLDSHITNFTYNNSGSKSVKIYGDLILLETSSSGEINIGVTFKDEASGKYGIGVIRVDTNPSTGAITNWLKVDGDLLPNTNFVVRTSGKRAGLSANDLVILYSNKLYFWTWKSVEQAPYFQKSLLAGFTNFKQISYSEQNFILMKDDSVKYMNIFEPHNPILEINKIDKKPWIFC
jgi:hypothetical protein